MAEVNNNSLHNHNGQDEVVPDYADHGFSDPPPYSTESTPNRTRPQRQSEYESREQRIINRPFSPLVDIKIIPESHLEPLIRSFDPSRVVGYHFRQDKGTITQILKGFEITAMSSTLQIPKEHHLRANITMTTRETLVSLHCAGQKESFASLIPSSIRKVANPATTRGEIIPPPDPTAKYSFAIVDPRYLFSLPDVPMRIEFDASFQADGLKRSNIWVWGIGDRWFRWAKWLPIDAIKGDTPVQNVIRSGGLRLDVAIVDGIGEIVRSLPFEKACAGTDSDLWVPVAIWRKNQKSALSSNLGHVEWVLSKDSPNPTLPDDLAAVPFLSSVSNCEQGPQRWERFVLAMLATLAHVKVPFDPKRDPSVAAAFGIGMGYGL